MSADKGMAGSVSGPVGIRGTMFLGGKKKKAENLNSGYLNNDSSFFLYSAMDS
jgi:hypothetical protein